MPRRARGLALKGLGWPLLALLFRPLSAADSSCLASTSRTNVSIGGWELTVEPHEDLAAGAHGSAPCRGVHGGYEGLLSLHCRAEGGLVADASACHRVGCPRPRQFLRRSAEPELTALQLENAPESGSCRWTAFARTSDHRLLAAPCSATNALELDSEGTPRTIAGSFAGALKYKTTVAVPGRAVAYGLPFFSSQVLRIDAELGSASAVGGPFGSGGSKWLGGAYAAGKVFGVPFDHRHVLRVDAASESVSAIGPDLGALSPQGRGKWWEAVAVGDLVLGIPCGATELLLVDGATETVRTFGGPFVSGISKWHGAVAIPGTGRVYAMPYDASRVLKVDVWAEEAWLIGPDFGLDSGKWHTAVLSADGRVYAVPSSSPQVLRLDPATDDVRLIGQALPGQHKWLHSVLMPSGRVLGLPGNSPALLLFDPDTGMHTLVESDASRADGVIGKWSGASLSLNGHAYAPPAGAASLLRFSEGDCMSVPRPIDEVCTMGEQCDLTLAGPAVQGGANMLWVTTGHCSDLPTLLATFQGWTNPKAAQELTLGLAHFALGVATSGRPLQVGAYRLCWSDDFAHPKHDVGSLTVLGPAPLNATCTLGQPCSLELVAGRGLLPGDEVAVLVDTGMNESVQWPEIHGLVNPANSTTAGRHALGVPLAGDLGTYRLLWGRQAWGEWRVELGSFELLGPVQSGSVSCVLGAACQVAVRGSGLAPGDRIALGRLPHECGEGASGWSLGSGVRGWCDEGLGWCSPDVAVVGGGETVYALGTAAAFPDAGTLPSFALCWESAAGGSAGRPRFAVRLGLVELRGPVVAAMPSGHLLSCKLGFNCSLSLPGYGLLPSDSLALLAAGALADVGFPANPIQATTLVRGPTRDVSHFDFGAAQRAPGQYLLSWRTSSLPANEAGLVELGWLLLEENGCAAPLVPGAASPSCAEGATLPHGSQCSPRCGPDSDVVSVAGALRCEGGELTPAGFTCLRRCLTPPTMAMGGEQAHCGALPSGGRCIGRCPGGYVKSGDFVCRDGRYEHQSNPALSSGLLWAVPRCYRPCPAAALNASNAGLPCAGESAVPHGGRCRTTCLEGRGAFDATGTFPLPELLCRDGSFQPSSFLCLRSCQAPGIEHAMNLDRCHGTPHGQTCELQCKAFHRKTGDLHCQDGVFQLAACLRPCNASAAWPRGLPNGPVVPCLGLGPEGLLMHGTVCRPSCSAGFSNSLEAEHPTCWDGALVLASGGTAQGLRCHADCPGRPSMGLVPHSLDLGSACEDLRHGQECPLQCEDEAEAVGSIRCEDGRYLGGACLQRCLLPVVRGSLRLDHCHRTEHNASCPFECQENHLKVGELRCLYGSWESLDLCMAPCSALSAEEASGRAADMPCAEGGLVMHGGRCSYRCVEGYGTSTIASCQDGALQPSAFRCHPLATHTCGPPEAPGLPPALTDLCAGLAHGEICAFSACLPGFVKSRPLRCEHGSWSTDACIDLRPRCHGPLPRVANGSMLATCIGSLEGAWCPLTCDPGFAPGVGAGFTCDEAGHWVGTASCAPVACGLPKAPVHGEMQCNGGAVADRCQVTCRRGYGSDGALVCVNDAATGAWDWRPEAGTPLCGPLPCGSDPLVPGVVGHSCAGLQHGGSCSAFACQAGLVSSGAFRCFLGDFVDVPACLPAPHGVVDVLAVTFRLEARVTAYWTDVQNTTNWGQHAARLAKLALNRSLADQHISKILLLGWSESNGPSVDAVVGPGAGPARRLRVDVLVDYLAALLPEPPSAGRGAALALAARVVELTPLGLATVLVGEPGPTSSQGEADLQFMALGPPSLRPVPQPAPAPPPPTTTRASTTTVLSTTSLPTTTTLPVASAVPSDIEQFVRSHILFVSVSGGCVVGVFICCCCIRCRNHRLMLKVRSLPRKTFLPKLELVRNTPSPDVAVDRSTMQAIAALDSGARKQTQVTTNHKQMALMRQMYSAQDTRQGELLGQETATMRARRDSIDSVVSLYRSEGLSENEPDLDPVALNILRASRAVVHQHRKRLQDEGIRRKKKPGKPSMWGKIREDNIAYLMRSQADFELSQDLPDDFVQTGGNLNIVVPVGTVMEQSQAAEENSDAEKSAPPSSPEHGPAQIHSARSAGSRRQEEATSRSPRPASPVRSPREDASPRSPRRASPAASPRGGAAPSTRALKFDLQGSEEPKEQVVMARRGSLSKEAAVVGELTSRRSQGLAPVRVLNRKTLHNHGRSSVRYRESEPLRRNFMRRARGVVEEGDPENALGEASLPKLVSQLGMIARAADQEE